MSFNSDAIESSRLTQYQTLELKYFDTAWYYSALAGIFSWMLLAGYLISPSTYASFGDSEALDKAGGAGKSLMKAVRNTPLIVLASTFCIVATLVLVALWRRHRDNYIWIQRHIITCVLLVSILLEGC